MFARSVSIRLKPNTVAEFTRLFDKETLPLLRKQKGFQDEIMLVVPGGQEAFGISLWDNKENTEAYGRGSYGACQQK
jgi:heme-degrading monooxygenase HmoA